MMAMSKPSVAIQLDVIRNFRYSRKAIAQIEDVLGIPFKNINPELQTHLATLIWGGLVWEDPRLTIDKVFDLLDEFGDELIMQKMNEAVRLAFPEKK